MQLHDRLLTLILSVKISNSILLSMYVNDKSIQMVFELVNIYRSIGQPWCFLFILK